MNATFTAAQIAAALGKSPRVVRRALDGYRPDAEIWIRGKAATWKIESLPVAFQEELEKVRVRRNLPTIDALFSEPAPWQPEFPWREVCPEQQAEAIRLQRALLPILERHRSPILDNGDLVEIGL